MGTNNRMINIPLTLPYKIEEEVSLDPVQAKSMSQSFQKSFYWTMHANSTL